MATSLTTNGAWPSSHAIISNDGCVDIGFDNARRWTSIRRAYGYVSDAAFATYLLDRLSEQPKSSKASNSTSSNHEASSNNGDSDGGSIGVTGTDGQAENDWPNADVDGGTMDEDKSDDNEASEEATAVANETDCSSDDDESNESHESLSEDEKDVDWTPASVLCETQLTCQYAGVDGAASREVTRQTRSRLHAGVSAETEPHKRRRSLPAVNSLGDKKIRQKLCLGCNRRHSQSECPLAMPAVVVADSAIDPSDHLTRLAESTLPKMLRLMDIDDKQGPGVVAVERIAQYTQFGPLIGERISELDIHEDMDLKYIWEIFSSQVKLYVSTSNENTSNWLRYVRPAPSKSQLNVSVIAKEDQLYFVTSKGIEPGTELVYWVDDPTWPWTKNTPAKTTCHTCNKRFGHLLYYRMHCVIFHVPNGNFTVRKFRCKVCGIAVLGRETLRRHASEMHDGKGAYQCQYCNKFFIRDTSMDVHRTYHCKLNPNRCWPLCDLCGKEFSNPNKLKEHIRRMHSDDSEVLKEFQCKLCLKLLSSSTSLQRHMKEVHKQDQSVASTCDRCGKNFRNMSNLKIHMLTHSGVKPFQCTEIDCNAAFTTKQCLQFHYKKVHGYTTDTMPVIERSVAYTFENYAGGDETAE